MPSTSKKKGGWGLGIGFNVKKGKWALVSKKDNRLQRQKGASVSKKGRKGFNVRKEKWASISKRDNRLQCQKGRMGFNVKKEKWASISKRDNRLHVKNGLQC